MAGRTLWTVNGRGAAALLAFALFLQMLVPTGWMPAEGRIGIRPCLPQAAATQPIAAHSAHHAEAPSHHQPQQAPDEQGHGQSQACAFALLAAALLEPPSADAVLPVADFPIAIPAGQDRSLRPTRPLAAPPPPATGPPARA